MTVHSPEIDRVRAALSDQPSAREVRMFGALAFMVNEKMVVALQRDGDLLVRVSPDRDDELLARPGARPAEMGAGRSMGPGWISVAADAVAGDDDLLFWINVALDYNAQGA
jgi:TfoX/Sxy family transcriptional regulator of competence genes